ncbi:MAG: Asp-tRNA(Asn)/Glu-tRNA(Gln) amidotransferase GatCAB subunit B, partial [Deltaproteobacteria bacterium]|nr:Asp-tRNA(Asn)/Glu-tRNA(Gln) amidotransferase GatCAB subunit B [Deltaproteobacteria bacterium]
PKGSTEMNTKVEVKNMNSIRHVGDAIAYEIKRQTASVMADEAVTLHTRLWDPDKKVTSAMRAKFEGPCVPDPVVPAIRLSGEWIEEMKSRLPEMPSERAERFVKEYALTNDEARFLSSDPATARYFEGLTDQNIQPRTAMHWLTTQLIPALRERGHELDNSPITPERFGLLLKMLAGDEINANAAREVLAYMFDSNESPESIVKSRGFVQVSDTAELEDLIDQVLSQQPAAVEDVKAGQDKAIGFLVGQIMKISQGKANPKRVKDLLVKRLRS